MRDVWTRWASFRWGRNGGGRWIFMVEIRPYPKGAILNGIVEPPDPRPLELHITDRGEPYYLRGERS